MSPRPLSIHALQLQRPGFGNEMAQCSSDLSPIDSASPSPTLMPTPALSYASSNRSFSTNSSFSDQSYRSVSSTSGQRSMSASSQRRGYVRPQGANFADSARNRDSVMSLGSIAHLQYYFARTGLLDGKGGQLAKQKENGQYDIPTLSLVTSSVVSSPIEAEGQLMWEIAKEEGDSIMLPPTVSTYSHKTYYVPSPPDQKTLKKDLVDSLENALKALEESVESSNADTEEQTQGFYEIQGLHILDTTTLAIKAARQYYTMHPHPERLRNIKSDAKIRKDLISVTDVLKKWAGRKFAGGLREDERLALLIWVSEVGAMIDKETRLEEAERREREGWDWMEDDQWTGRTEEREISFLNSLQQGQGLELLPHWQPSAPKNRQTNFLKLLADGRILIDMHNAAVRRSKKQFEHIKTRHEDVGKPYRRTENLRFWIKAAELRWEVKLYFDVMSIVNSKDDAKIWQDFEKAVLAWSRAVREEVTRDWKEDEERKLHSRAKSIAMASPHNSPRKQQSGFEPRAPVQVQCEE